MLFDYSSSYQARNAMLKKELESMCTLVYLANLMLPIKLSHSGIPLRNGMLVGGYHNMGQTLDMAYGEW